MAKEKLLRLEEVALLVGVSGKTLNNWYAWKRTNPDSELVALLPDYVQEGARQTRLWRKEDVYKLIEFRTRIPQGRNGILGSVTQKYVKKKDKTCKTQTNEVE